jgi:hypothetical protein
MGRRADSRQHELKVEALKGITSHKTVASYKQSIDAFASWEKETYGKDFDHKSYKINREHIQAYANDLAAKGTSPSSIHTKLAPVCKGVKIPMEHIDKPKRSAGTLTRDRNIDANKQGKRELESPKFEKSVSLARATGLRRSELAHLTKENLKYDESGHMCVEVLKGKGGKYQLQRILPQHQDTVKKIFDATEPGKPVLEKKDMSRHISYHSIRADVAKEAYDYYKHRIDTEPGYRQELRNELIERFKAQHNKHGNCDPRALEKFKKQLDKVGDYKLRGENKEVALKNGRPIEYDRVGLMATSVFDLSHWRPGVAIENYLSKL